MDFSSVTNPFEDNEGGKDGNKAGEQQSDGPQEVKEQDEQRKGDKSGRAGKKESPPRSQPDETWLFLKVS